VKKRADFGDMVVIPPKFDNDPAKQTCCDAVVDSLHDMRGIASITHKKKRNINQQSNQTKIKGATVQCS
jgi:hypothetical protein